MKKLILIQIFTILFTFTSCVTTYLVEKSTGKEYVLLKELPLNAVDRFIIHWKTQSDSPFAKFDSRTGKFFYLKTYDYSKVVHIKTETIQDNINTQSKEFKWAQKLLWILAGSSIFIFFLIWWHQNQNKDNEDDSYPL
jgi:hypothetical protein